MKCAVSRWPIWLEFDPRRFDELGLADVARHAGQVPLWVQLAGGYLRRNRTPLAEYLGGQGAVRADRSCNRRRSSGADRQADLMRSRVHLASPKSGNALQHVMVALVHLRNQDYQTAATAYARALALVADDDELAIFRLSVMGNAAIVAERAAQVSQARRYWMEVLSLGRRLNYAPGVLRAVEERLSRMPEPD